MYSGKRIRTVREIILRVAPADLPIPDVCGTCHQAYPLVPPSLSRGDYGSGQDFAVSDAVHAAMIAAEEGVDATPAVLTEVAAGTITTTGAHITGTSDRACKHLAWYRVHGETNWVTTILSGTWVTSHDVALTGLAVGTEYDAVLAVTPQYGDPIISDIVTFTTLAT